MVSQCEKMLLRAEENGVCTSSSKERHKAVQRRSNEIKNNSRKSKFEKSLMTKRKYIFAEGSCGNYVQEGLQSGTDTGQSSNVKGKM